uniref:Putative secreted protein n=1 Tax=Ixodes ricinus TaxID=34613 RepID=A0A6B0U1G4_IXORI
MKEPKFNRDWCTLVVCSAGLPAAPALSLSPAGAAGTLPVRAVAAQKVCCGVFAFPLNVVPPSADLPSRGCRHGPPFREP